MDINRLVLQKYNVPTPRYTSYPTVPFWNEEIDKPMWLSAFRSRFAVSNKAEGISLYVHLPYCESLCTYCGCNKKITANHSVEAPYINAILREWEMYCSLVREKPVLRELHYGGGTPSFFSPANLALLTEGLIRRCDLHPQYEFSIEGHPNNTTREHLKLLYQYGFRRISYGVQDNNPEVQKLINRIQPFENVKAATDAARDIGFHSVNFDLIYGLPLQNKSRIQHTILQSISLKPDRIAYYSYAHVPWASKGQRLYDESDLPSAEEKMQLYQLGKEMFYRHGYANIGMDHFALPGDELYTAHNEGRLHRNFMGYTSQKTAMLIGLGVSAISDTGNAYAQNDKSLHRYLEAIKENKIPVIKGYFLDEEDLSFKKYILDISCRGETHFRNVDLPLLQENSFPLLEVMKADGLLHFNGRSVKLTATGHSFLRNVCSAFDMKMLKRGPQSAQPLFSRAV